RDSAQVTFDFLDSDDGVSFEMFYSTNDENIEIYSSGTIKGAKDGIQRRGTLQGEEFNLILPVNLPFAKFKLNGLAAISSATFIYLALSILTLISAIHNTNGDTVIDWPYF